jgi:regulator of cell morphogenesis and NO signaling
MKSILHLKPIQIALTGFLVLPPAVTSIAAEQPLVKIRRTDIMKHEIEKNITVGDLIVQYPQLRQSLESLGIDYCCGGKKPLSIAVDEAGLHWNAVEAALTDALAAQPQADTRDWNPAPLSELADHILDKHHVFMWEQLPRLDGLLAKVEKAHTEHHSEMLAQLRSHYSTLRTELESHLTKEEQILFPLIKQTDAYVNGNGAKPVAHCGSVANPIRQMEFEHDEAGKELVAMRKLTDGYLLPPDACPTFAALYEGLAAMEDDLHEHIHLENNILFPKSMAQEATINR